MRVRASRALLLVAILAALPWGCSGCPGLPWSDEPEDGDSRREARVVDSRTQEAEPEPPPPVDVPAPEPESTPPSVTLRVRLGDVVPVRLGDSREVTLAWDVKARPGHVHVGVWPPGTQIACTVAGEPLTAGLRVALEFGEAYELPWEGTERELRCSFVSTEPTELLAIFAPIDETRATEAPRAQFPSDPLLDELAAQIGEPFPAAFSRRRQAPWGVPRATLLAKAAPRCSVLEEPIEARRCCAALLEAILAALAPGVVENEAMLRSLAIYLDDDAVANAIDALAAGDDRRVAMLQPSSSAVASARAITDRLFAASEASVADALAPEPQAPPGELEPVQPTLAPVPPPVVGTVSAPLEKLRPLTRELHRSRAGRELLDFLTGDRRRDELIAVSLLVRELETDVRSFSAQLVDGGDARLVAAARALDDIPKRAATPTAAVMVLLDEWTERVTAPEHYPSVIERLQKEKLPRSKLIESWLAQQFPVYYPRAQRVLAAVAPPPAAD